MLLTNKRVFNYVNKRTWDFVVCDEFHLCRNPLAGRTDVTKRILEKAPYTKILTGTPIVNSGADTFSAMSHIIPRIKQAPSKLKELCTDWDRYAKTFSYKYVTASDVLYKKVKNPEALRELFYSYGFFYRKLKRDVLKELPPKTFMHIELPVKAGRSLYTIDLNKLQKKLEDNDTRFGKDAPALATPIS